MLEIKDVDYMGWPRCLHISNGHIELVVTTVIGPRIIHFSTTGNDNLFFVDETTAGQQGGDLFHLYGGHRLWRAPEDREQTYFPDNGMVMVENSENVVRLVAPIEPTTHLQKEIILRIEDPNAVVLTHRITNYAPYPQEISAWGITMMRAGGVALIPLPALTSHSDNLLPTQQFNLWGYTNLADARWSFKPECIYLWQEPIPSPQKMGLTHGRGWLAYCLPQGTFVKQYVAEEKVYPDFGSVVEVFTDHNTLELETLSPLADLESADSVEHHERWILLEPIEDSVLENEADAMAWIEAQL